MVTGGEAQFRELRGMITRQPVTNTEQPEDTPPPDVHHTSPDPFCSDLEGQRGIQMPVQFFAIIESALRYHQGLGIEEHRDEVARCTAPSARSPRRIRTPGAATPMSAEEIRDADSEEPDAGVSLHQAPLQPVEREPRRRHPRLLGGEGRRARDCDASGWIFPVAATQSRHVVVRPRRDGCTAIRERSSAVSGRSRWRASTATTSLAAELYSCFPSAIRCFARDLKLKSGCPLTVTGSMAFAGGPFNHFSLEGVARMVEVLRAGGDDARGEDASAWSPTSAASSASKPVYCCRTCPTTPATATKTSRRAVAAQDLPLPLDGDYAGPATIVGYTVVFNGETLSHGIAFCDTPNGERTVVRTDDEALLASMTREEFCGRVIEILSGGRFR